MKPSACHNSKDLQFICVNNKFIGHSDCCKMISKTFKHLLEKKNKATNVDRLFPVFFLQILCPSDEFYSVHDGDTRLTVIFKDWDSLYSCLRDFIKGHGNHNTQEDYFKKVFPAIQVGSNSVVLSNERKSRELSIEKDRKRKKSLSAPPFYRFKRRCIHRNPESSLRTQELVGSDGKVILENLSTNLSTPLLATRTPSALVRIRSSGTYTPITPGVLISTPPVKSTFLQKETFTPKAVTFKALVPRLTETIIAPTPTEFLQSDLSMKKPWRLTLDQNSNKHLLSNHNLDEIFHNVKPKLLLRDFAPPAIPDSFPEFHFVPLQIKREDVPKMRVINQIQRKFIGFFLFSSNPLSRTATIRILK
eukprot:TRINITY_DN2371_c0_g1_i24.p1 TRINITY_DN2371_c0_g1~~TRINITY_DN2371_c0_g1_i24.p1  ORF type:complete len:362 (+),score=38.47 TRINITY_DN2371_c0_g1_i24:779-1864(+)